MLLDVKKISFTLAIISSVKVFTGALRALTGKFLLAFIDVIAVVNAVSSESWRTLAARQLSIQTCRELHTVTVLVTLVTLPTASVVYLASSWTRWLTLVVSITLELDTLHNGALADTAPEGVHASRDIRLRVLPATSVVGETFI